LCEVTFHLNGEVLNFGIEGSNFKIDVLDISLVLVDVFLQGNDSVVKNLVEGC
jgi:hypothetical protein